jgi:serine/threonine-protein kinase
VSQEQPAASSNDIIQDLHDHGGWGHGNVFQIDFSITLQHATASTEFVSWDETGDWYSPDCDHQPMPAPAGGALEGEDGYACDHDGDCHLLVVDDSAHKLYEMWRANQVSANHWEGGCQVVWDLTKHYPANLRGDGCTSADAAGFPMAALLFTADEVAAGHIDHAIRFILPNDRIRHGSYVHPATHSTNPTSGGPNAPPYGVRLRLRADFNVDALPSEGAKVVARALQKYGMLLSDGGQIALTAADDRFSTAKWSNLLDAHDLAGLAVTDFEVVELGTPVPLDDCALNP